MQLPRNTTADGTSYLLLTGQSLDFSMSSLLDHGLIRTAAVEQVVAPMASHLCHLVLLCDGEMNPEQVSQLERAAGAVARATENVAAVASRYESQICWCISVKSHCNMYFVYR